MEYDDEDTVEDFPAVEPTDDVVAESFLESRLEIGAITHRGKVRSRNEDQFAVIRRARSSQVLASSVDDHPSCSEEHAWLLAVADGVGGQVSGQVASATAIRAMLNLANGMSSWIMRPADGLRADIEARVELYVQAIQNELQEKADSDPTLAGMATTVTAAYVYGNTALIVNIGDSRSYIVRGDNIQQITRDHTLAQQLQDAGLPADSTRAYRNVLTRCFGTNDKPVNFDIFQLEVSEDDRLLLCSDGLTDMLPDADILDLLREADSTKDACQQLVASALDRGGRDNITLVLVRVLPCANLTRDQSQESESGSHEAQPSHEG